MASGILLKLARQWIAGESAQDGIERVRIANQIGVLGLLNLLGEHVNDKDQVAWALSEYSRLLELIQESKVNSQISAKPSQLGINIDYEYCVSNYLSLAESCSLHNQNWLWIDMEDASFTDKTIELYSRVLKDYQNSGVAIQAYLMRSEKDVRSLLRLGGKVRLVKGAYNESSSIAFKGKDKVRESYLSLLELLFSKECFFAVATHDNILIERSRELAQEYGNKNFEFEMLMGVRDSLKEELVKENYQVREYIPYGPEWLPYSIRRIKEKKSNILLLGRSVFSR